MSKTPAFHCFAIHLYPNPTNALHTHDSHEFFFCTKGGGSQFTDRNEFTQTKGDLFVFPAGQQHCCTVRDKRGCGGIVLNALDGALPHEMDADPVARRVQDKICERALAGDNRLALSSAGRRALHTHFQTMAGECHLQERGYTTAISIAYQSVLLTILRDPQSAPLFTDEVRPSAGAERIANVLRYLEYHHVEQVTVEDMAERACMSRSHFHSTFKQETGYTLVEYVNHLRAQTAERMLSTTDLPILEIALACGFPTLSHFYHVFRRIRGVTPRQIRKQASGGE